MKIPNLEALREEAPVLSPLTWASRGVWVGGRVFVDHAGDAVFVPCGAKRSDVPGGKARKLIFLGDGLKNERGWGDPAASGAMETEIVLTNPIQ